MNIENITVEILARSSLTGDPFTLEGETPLWYFTIGDESTFNVLDGEGVLGLCILNEEEYEAWALTTKQDVVFRDNGNIISWKDLSNINIGYCIEALPDE